ncbi:MAG TPA: hypothetical protein VGD59_14950 [Acidisarcina sp.]
MRNIIRNLILAPAVLCASAAFAADSSTLNVPFGFTSNGKAYPAGHYTVSVSSNRHVATLHGREGNGTIAAALLLPGSGDPNAPENMKLIFINTPSSHELSRIQYGVLSTSDLAKRDSYRNEAAPQNGSLGTSGGR